MLQVATLLWRQQWHWLSRMARRLRINVRNKNYPKSCLIFISEKILFFPQNIKWARFSRIFFLFEQTPDGMGRSLNQLKPHVFRFSIRRESISLQLESRKIWSYGMFIFTTFSTLQCILVKNELKTQCSKWKFINMNYRWKTLEDLVK